MLRFCKVSREKVLVSNSLVTPLTLPHYITPGSTQNWQVCFTSLHHTWFNTKLAGLFHLTTSHLVQHKTGRFVSPHYITPGSTQNWQVCFTSLHHTWFNTKLAGLFHLTTSHLVQHKTGRFVSPHYITPGSTQNWQVCFTSHTIQLILH